MKKCRGRKVEENRHVRVKIKSRESTEEGQRELRKQRERQRQTDRQIERRMQRKDRERKMHLSHKLRSQRACTIKLFTDVIQAAPQ